MASSVPSPPPSLFCGDTCLGESHKVGEADSASLLDACQPVQRMTENGRQQRGTAHLTEI